MDYKFKNEFPLPNRSEMAIYKEPLFAVSMWNLNDRAKKMLPKTNNSLEASHKAFMSNFYCAHPALSNFIKHGNEDIEKQITAY